MFMMKKMWEKLFYWKTEIGKKKLKCPIKWEIKLWQNLKLKLCEAQHSCFYKTHKLWLKQNWRKKTDFKKKEKRHKVL